MPLPPATTLTAGAILTLALPDDVTATIPCDPEFTNESKSPLPTAKAAFPESVTVLPDVDATVPTLWWVVTSYTVIPAATQGKAVAKFSVLLAVVVAALLTAVGPLMMADSPTLIDIGPANASVSPPPTGLTAFCVKVAVVAVVEATVPTTVPVVWS